MRRFRLFLAQCKYVKIYILYVSINVGDFLWWGLGLCCLLNNNLQYIYIYMSTCESFQRQMWQVCYFIKSKLFSWRYVVSWNLSSFAFVSFQSDFNPQKDGTNIFCVWLLEIMRLNMSRHCNFNICAPTPHTHRRRSHTEEKAKVVAAAWGDRIYWIPCRASYLAK